MLKRREGTRRQIRSLHPTHLVGNFLSVQEATSDNLLPGPETAHWKVDVLAVDVNANLHGRDGATPKCQWHNSGEKEREHVR